jgi:hypothetical protein
MREFYRSICECGERNPEFNGYCAGCLTKLKQKYEVYAEDYRTRCHAYESMIFDEYNRRQKAERVVRRLKSMHRREVMVDPQDAKHTDSLFEHLEDKTLKRGIEEFRV